MPIEPVYGLPMAVSRDHAYSDRFKTGVLGQWWTNPTVSVQPNVLAFDAGGGLHLRGSIANKHVYGVRQPAPVGAFTIWGRMQSVGSNTTDLRNGIFIGTTGNKAMVLGPFPQDGNFGVLGVGTTSNTADWSGYDGYLTNIGGSPYTPRWYRLTWDGAGQISYSYSNDVSAEDPAWTGFGSRTGLPTPDQIGFCLFSNSGAIQTNAELFIDRWRVT